MTELLSKDDIWRNLTNRDGIAVKIGTENLVQELHNATVVTSQISVKGTTTEKLGFCGREEGIAATASVLLEVTK